MRKTLEEKKNATPVRMAKMSLPLWEEFRKIAAIRFANGKDKRFSPPTVQKKTLNHPLWGKIRKDLEIADFVEDKKGQFNYSVFNIFTFVIVAFMIVVLFGGLIYVSGLLNTTFQDVGIQYDQSHQANEPGYVNLTQAAHNTFGKMNESIQSLRLVAITLIFSEMLLLVGVAAYARKYPWLFIVWIFIVFLAVMLAAPVANSYEELLHSGIYGGNLQSFTGANWILLNLPTVTLVLGVLMAILMFINIVRPSEETSI